MRRVRIYHRITDFGESFDQLVFLMGDSSLYSKEPEGPLQDIGPVYEISDELYHRYEDCLGLLNSIEQEIKALEPKVINEEDN